MAFGCDVFPEKRRCYDASNKHRKWGNPEAFISVFLPGLLEKKYANTLFLEMLTTPQLITCSLLRRQGLRNRMGKLRHGEASQDGLPETHTASWGPQTMCPGAGAARGGRYPSGDPLQRGCPSASHPAASQSALVLGQWPVRAGARPHVIHGIGMRAFPVTGGRQGPTRRGC